MARQAARIGVPIIHLSTVYVFAGDKSEAYVEGDAVRPVNAYGRSKQAGERAVANANPRHVILRTGWVYSPFGRNFVRSILDRGARETDLAIDDEQRGSPSYAPHIAAAILDIAARVARVTMPDAPNAPWGTYHIADSGTARWCDLAREAFRASGALGGAHPLVTPRRSPATGQASRPRNAMLDCAKLDQVFGIRLAPWQDGVRDCVERICAT